MRTVKLLSKTILIAGQKRSGKDTVAGMLQQQLTASGHTVALYSFAAPMKSILATTLGISLEALDELKNDPNDSTYRGYLQRLGTEAIKPIFGESVWGDLAAKFIKDSTADYVIISDFRFPTEITPLSNYTTVKVLRSGLTSDTHISENALNGYSFNHTISNNGTLEDLASATAVLASGL